MTAEPAPESVAAPGALPLVTRRQLVAILGVSLRGFADLEAAGLVTAARPGRGGRPSLYDLTAAVPAYLRHVERARQPNGERDARARRDLAQAQLAEQLHKRRSGDLLERAEVKQAWVLIIHAIRSRLLRMPQALAPRCAAATSPAAVERILHDEVRSALTELAGWQGPKDDYPTPAAGRRPRQRRTAV